MAGLDFLVPNGLLGSNSDPAMEDTEMAEADANHARGTAVGSDASFTRIVPDNASQSGGIDDEVDEGFGGEHHPLSTVCTLTFE